MYRFFLRFFTLIMIIALLIEFPVAGRPVNANHVEDVVRETNDEFIYFPLVITGCRLPDGEDKLRDIAQLSDKVIGTAVTIDALRNDPVYGQVLAQEFNMLADGWAMKFEYIHPEFDRYNFTAPDEIVNFAEAHNMLVRGHTLVWGFQLPAWLTVPNWTREELLNILHDHIATVVGHYKGRIVMWDVVNEAMGADGLLKNNFWLRNIGPEYIELAFQWAHEADPDALLFYNDYGSEGLGPKADGVYALVKDLKERGIPIHGVGLEAHASLGWSPDPQNVAQNIERLAALGFEVQISEMDVQISGYDATWEEKLELQAVIYQDMLEACLLQDACTGFVTWGFTDKYSWIYKAFNKSYPDEAPLILHPNYEPKPAYHALRDSLVEWYCEGY